SYDQQSCNLDRLRGGSPLVPDGKLDGKATRTSMAFVNGLRLSCPPCAASRSPPLRLCALPPIAMQLTHRYPPRALSRFFDGAGGTKSGWYWRCMAFFCSRLAAPVFTLLETLRLPRPRMCV